MRVLVTGAGGFAGQHLIAALLERGDAEIWGGVLDGTPPAAGILSVGELARVRWLALDVSSPASLRTVVGDSDPEIVYHLAGQSSVSGSFEDPVGTWDVNATGTLRLLEALRNARGGAGAGGRGGTRGAGEGGAGGAGGAPGAGEARAGGVGGAGGAGDPEGAGGAPATGGHEGGGGGASTRAGGVRVLVVSSAEVYGVVPEERQPIREDEPLRPITPYGASKMGAEAAALQAAASREITVLVARSFNHAGPGQDERFALPSMARQLAEMRVGEREPVLRVGNLSPLRDFLDVRDVVRAYIAMVERGENGGVYNVCSGESLPMTEIVEALVRLSGTGARIDVDPARFRPVEIPLLVGERSRLGGLGWSPEIPLERTLADLLESAGALARAAPGAAR